MYLLKAGMILIVLGVLTLVSSAENSDDADNQFTKAVANISKTCPESWEIVADWWAEKSFRLSRLEHYGDRISKEEAILAGLPNDLAEASKYEIKEKKSGIFEPPENDTFIPDFPGIHFVIFESHYPHHGITNIPGSRLVYVTDCRNISNSIFDDCCGYLIVPNYSEMWWSYNDANRYEIRLFNYTFHVLNRGVHFEKSDIVRGIDDCVVNTLKEYNDKTVQNNIRKFLKLQQSPITFKFLLKLFNGTKIE